MAQQFRIQAHTREIAMNFAGINYIAIPVAAVASFAFGAVWYMTLAKPWMAATGRTEEELKSGVTPLIYVVTFICQLVMAFVLAGVIGHLGSGEVTVSNGLISGGLVWLGFVITSMIVNHGYQGASRMLTVIDGGHWLGVLLIQGLLIGLFGV